MTDVVYNSAQTCIVFIYSAYGSEFKSDDDCLQVATYIHGANKCLSLDKLRARGALYDLDEFVFRRK